MAKLIRVYSCPFVVNPPPPEQFVQRIFKKSLTNDGRLAMLATHTVIKNTHMRTKSLVIAAAALTAGLLSASAQAPVYSQNVVGYVNVVLPGSGAYSLISNPLNAPTNDLKNLLVALPNGQATVLNWTG